MADTTSLNAPPAREVAAPLRIHNGPIAFCVPAGGDAGAAPPGIDEPAIVARAQAGEEAAFNALYARDAAGLQHYLYRCTHDWQRAEELAADAWLKAWLALPATRTRGPLRWRAWLYRIAANVAIDDARHRQLVTQVPWAVYLSRWHPSQVAPDDPAAEVAAREHEAECRALLDQLPPPERRALALQAHAELSYDALARVLGMTVGGTRSLLWRARERLRYLQWGERAIRHPVTLRSDPTACRLCGAPLPSQSRGGGPRPRWCGPICRRRAAVLRAAHRLREPAVEVVGAPAAQGGG